MSASVPPSASSDSEQPRGLYGEPARRPGRRRTEGPPVVPARAADHTAIHHFLTAVFQCPAKEEFRAALEDPFYEPSDRLLIRSDGKIVAHGHVTRRVMQFNRLALPVAGLHELGVLPDYHGRGYGRRLLAAAEAAMARDGAVIGLAWTNAPRFLRSSGWAFCCRHCRSGAAASNLRAGLESRGLRRLRFNIRPWRQTELGALVRIYEENLGQSHGPFQRTEDYWRWLIARKAFDQIYVALDGPDVLELEESQSPIVGYAITRGAKILELFTAAGRFRAAAELLDRACSDTIERACHSVVLHARPGSPLDKLFRRAGGRRADCATCGRGVLMAKLLDPLRLLGEMGGRLNRRAIAAGMPLPLSLGLLVDGKKYQVEIGRDNTRVASGHVGRSYLQLCAADFTRLLLGQLDLDRALAEGRATASTALAQKAARAIFRRHHFWRPPLDELSV